jgi:hypothetical protein
MKSAVKSSHKELVEMFDKTVAAGHARVSDEI